MIARLTALVVVLVFAWPAATQAAGFLPWSDHFASNDFQGWTWWGQGDPTYGVMSTPRADDERIPRWRSGYERVGRFEVDDPDAPHSKLFYTWPEDDAPPTDVSGSYTASYYIPSDYENAPGDDPANIFQFKETYDGDEQDPSWYLRLSSSRWSLTYDDTPVSWFGPRADGRSDRPVMHLSNWGGWNHPITFWQPPLDTWFEIRADLYEGDRIDFYIDGVYFDSAEDDEYPVGMFQTTGTKWTFGVGNYTENPSTLYVGEASYEPFDEPSGFEYRGDDASNDFNSSLTNPLPPGLTDGDTLVLIAGLSGDRSRTLTTPTGWTRHYLGAHVGGTFAVFTKPYVAGSTPAPTLTWGGATIGFTRSLTAWRGADPTSPVNAQATAVSAVANLYPTTPSITTTVDDALLVWSAMDDGGSGADMLPTGFDDRTWVTAEKLAGAAGVIPALRGAFASGGASPWSANVLALRPRDW